MDMVRFVLVGETGLDTEFDLTYITNALEDKHYFIKVKDQSKPKVDYDGFAHDISLKGEFVRLIKSKMEEGELSKEEAAEIIRAGISLLSTGEVSA